MIVFYRKKNNAKSTLSAAFSDSGTTLTVLDGSKFPATENFIITIWDKDTNADPGDDVNMEILKVTGVSGNVFTVVRAQEDTVAKVHSLGHAVEILFTVGQIEELEDGINTKRDDFTLGNGLTMASGSVLIINESQISHGNISGKGTNTHVQIDTHIADSTRHFLKSEIDVITLDNVGLHILDTDASHDLIIKPGSNLTADRTLSLVTGDVSRTLTIDADGTVSQWNTAYTHSQIVGGNSVHVSTTENSNWDSAYTHSQIAGGDSVHVSTTENTQWDTAYSHSQNNNQAHSDYLKNNADDVTTGNLEISKANPELKLTDIGDGNNVRLTRTDTLGQTTIYNTANKPAGNDNALDFDGVDDYVDLGSDGSLENMNELTLAVWIKIPIGTSVGNQQIFTKGNTGDYQYGLVLENANAVSILAWNSGGAAYLHATSSGTPLVDGEWHHIVGTVVNNSRADIYVDNVLEGSDTTPSGAWNRSGASTLRIAIRQDNRANWEFEGTVDEVAIWTEAISVNDISDLYNSGAGLFINKDIDWPTDGGSMGTNLVGLWHHDESAMNQAPGGLDTEDSSANSNHGTAEASMTDSDFVDGKIITGGDVESIMIRSKDGMLAGEKSVVQLSDPDSRTVIEGKTIRVNLGGVEKWNIDADGDIIPTTDNNVDMGDVTHRVKDSYQIGKHYFRDTAIGIYSQADTFLDLFADGGMRFGDSSGGAPTNYANFAPDGELTLVGTARVTKEIVLSAANIKSGAGGLAPTAATIGATPVLQFSTAANNTAYFTIHIPCDWDPTTDMEIHVHWAPTNGNSGTVQWDVDYTSLASESDEVLTAGLTSLTVQDSTQSLQDEVLESPSMTILAANIAVGDILSIALTRDVSEDNYGASASLINIAIEYTVSKLGMST